MKDWVSVIIPIYNIYPFIKTCLQSVCMQSYHYLEIILVDDGSTDGSAIACDQWASTDNRIKVYHKKNGGLSDARNYGLSKATGSYIIYLDGDDWIATNAVEKLVHTAQEYHADFIQAGYYYAYENYLLVYNEPTNIIEYNKENALKELISNGRIKNFVWGSLIKRELALQVPFIKGRYFEDSFWKYQIMELSNKFVYVAIPLFYYRQRPQSISGSFTLKNIDLLIGIEKRLQFIQKNYPQLFNLALNKYWNLTFNYMLIAQQSYDANIKETYINYFTNINLKYKEHLNKHLKLMYILYRRYYPLFYIITLIGRGINKVKKGHYLKYSYF
jgi:glycosyltransferase involved in cell wall biosynthesis